MMVAAGLLVAFVAGGACSGDDPPSRAAYRHDALAICRATRDATSAAPRTTDAAELVALGRESVLRQRRALREIRALRTPPGDERAIGRWLALVERTLAQAERSLDALEAGDLAAASRANQRGAALAAEAATVAEPLGLEDCGTPTT